MTVPERITRRVNRLRGWKWCFCVDFRVGTIALAIFQILVHLIIMGVLMMLVIRPNLLHDLASRSGIIGNHHHMMMGGHDNHMMMGSNNNHMMAPLSGDSRYSLPKSFRMLIFGREQTWITKDKDGKLHATHLYQIGQPLLMAMKPQDAKPDAASPLESSVGSLLRRDIFNKQAAVESKNGAVVDSMPHFKEPKAEAAIDSVARKVSHVMASMEASVSQHLREMNAHLGESQEEATQGDAGIFTLSCQRKRHHMLALTCTWVSLCFSCCLLYGAAMRRPLFMLPYLAVQVVCLLFYLVGLVHAFTFFPRMREWIEHKAHVPFKAHLLQLNDFQLGMVFLCTSMTILYVKVNLMCLVCHCYRALTMEKRLERVLQRHAQQRTRDSGENGGSMDILVDVPALIILESGEKNGEIPVSTEKEEPPPYFVVPVEGAAVVVSEEKTAKEEEDAPLLSA